MTGSKKNKPAAPDKAAVHEALRTLLKESLLAMAHAAEDARKGAVHEDNRSEGDKDMRATEQSYVARGQAMRTEQLAEDVARFEMLTPRTFAPDDAVSVSALVEVNVEDETRWFYVVAQGGGKELQVGGFTVTVLTPSSPAGSLLMGKSAGDEFAVRAGPRTRTWEVVSIH